MRALVLVCSLAFVAACPPDRPVESAATIKDTDLPADLDGLIKDADRRFAMQTEVEMKNAIVVLHKALGLPGGDSVEVLWRLARVHARLSSDYTDEQLREEHAQKAIEFGERALKADPKRVEAAYWLAIGRGEYVNVKREKAKDLVPGVLEAAKVAAGLDRKYEHAGPLRLLGSVYAQAPEPPVSVGDHEQGTKLLEEAVQISGGYPENHLLLGEAHLSAKKLDEAAAEFDFVLGLPPSALWGSRLKRWQDQATKGKRRIDTIRRQRAGGPVF